MIKVNHKNNLVQIQKDNRIISLIGCFVIMQLLCSCMPNYDHVPGLGNNKEYWQQKDHMRKMACEQIPNPFEKLKRIHVLKQKPRLGEWAYHRHEKGQSIKEYQKKYSIKINVKLKKIYIQPIGLFLGKQWQLIKNSANYIKIFFEQSVVFKSRIPVYNLPREARTNFGDGKEEIKTKWLLREFLISRRPNNAFALIAFTNHYLKDDDKWGYVYGLSSLKKRVGAWSVHYLAENPGLSKSIYRQALIRTIKMSIHEICHMLGIKHCVAYECIMNGCSSLEELDNNPITLCPLCLYKLCWKTGIKPIKRFKKLANFCKRNGLFKEEHFFRLSIKLMSQKD